MSFSPTPVVRTIEFQLTDGSGHSYPIQTFTMPFLESPFQDSPTVDAEMATSMVDQLLAGFADKDPFGWISSDINQREFFRIREI